MAKPAIPSRLVAPRETRPPRVEPVRPLDLALLHSLPSLALRARCVMDGYVTGLHRSPKKGFSVEFSDYRVYLPGDDLRRVDWRLFGRTDRLYLKEYEQETQLRVFLVLDTSASMDYSSRPGAWMKKIDFARTVLAALGLLALRQGDAFGMASIGDDLGDFLGPKSSQAHWRTLVGRMDAVKTGGTTGLAKGLNALAELLPRRSHLVIASDFYEDSDALNMALRRLRFDLHEVIGLHVLDPVEVGLGEDWNGTFVDSESGERMVLDASSVRKGYLERFQAFVDRTRTEFLNQGGDYALQRTDASPMAALGMFLASREHIH
jgi:uncharacterized protein (DUF58 family)